MNRRTESEHVAQALTTLGRETCFNGIMRYTQSLCIAGRFSGRIESPGLLHVKAGAEVRADIAVAHVIVSGAVWGDITARERLEILSGGKVYGNIRTAQLKIADGVVFEGRCEMIRNSEQVEIFSDTVDRVKAAVERPVAATP